MSRDSSRRLSQFNQKLRQLSESLKRDGNDDEQAGIAVFSLCAHASHLSGRRVHYLFDAPQDRNNPLPEEQAIYIDYNKHGRLELIGAGPALTEGQFNSVVELLETCILAAPTLKAGHSVAFSKFPVLSAYRSEQLAFQLLPVPVGSTNLPPNQIGGANHPFRLQFLCRNYPESQIHHLRLMKHEERRRELILFLHLALPYGFWSNHLWPRGLKERHLWVVKDHQSIFGQVDYFLTRDESEELENNGYTRIDSYPPIKYSTSERYYEMRFDDAMEVALPFNFDDLANSLNSLSRDKRRVFFNALFWFYQSTRADNASTAYIALIQSIESLLTYGGEKCERCEQSLASISDSFADFLERYAGTVSGIEPGDRKALYNARSKLAHGGVFAHDFAAIWSFEPFGLDEEGKLDRVERAARVGLLNWLLEQGTSRARLPFRL